jgi:cytochrome b pre-mRNA-processing protein 3
MQGDEDMGGRREQSASQMIFGLFRRSSNQAVIDRLHGEIMAAARQPTLFLDFGVPDTLEGRFEVLSLLATIHVRRLMALEQPGPQIAQQLTDALFANFDIALREAGVSDVGVPKRMKTLARAFLGRSAAYRTALADSDPQSLEGAIARYVVVGEGPGAALLADYVRRCAAALEDAGLEAYLKDGIPLPSATTDRRV